MSAGGGAIYSPPYLEPVTPGTTSGNDGQRVKKGTAHKAVLAWRRSDDVPQRGSGMARVGCPLASLPELHSYRWDLLSLWADPDDQSVTLSRRSSLDQRRHFLAW